MKIYHYFTLFIILAFSCKSTSNEANLNTETTQQKKIEKEAITQKHDRDKVDSTLVINALKTLSSDEFEGRKTGEAGNLKAQAFLIEQFKTLGLLPFGESYEQAFECVIDREDKIGKNIVGYIKGSKYPDSFIALAAHYDHEGIKNGLIYNGADDNASGVGGLLGAAAYYAKNQPLHSIVFLAFDAEERGLQGSYHFAKIPLFDLKNMRCLINMDMISRNPNRELYASGTYHFPALKPMIEKINQQNPHVLVQFGHDQPRKSKADPQDWTKSSDHAPFFKKGIPYIYFGVEDHSDYHKPTDDFEKINLEFYLDVVDFVIDIVGEFDQNLPR
ncbi:MAG: M28 family peptidase [Flammeovirgaceae bacterium]